MEEKLIAAVFKRKAIWDPADELRKNSKILKTLWTEVAKEVGINVDDAKKKWKNLRAYFISQMRELDKPRSGSGGGGKTISSWAYFQQLLFLKNVVNPLDEARDDNLTSTQSSQIVTNRRETQNIVQDIETETVLNSPLSEIIPDKLDNDTEDHTFSATVAEQTPSSKSNFRMVRASANKRKLNTGNQSRSDNTAAKVLEIETRKVELLEKEMNAEEDPNLLFFKSTPTQTLRLRGKIQEIISHAARFRHQ